MARGVGWTSLLLLVLMAASIAGDTVYTDEESVAHIDYLTNKGIRLMLLWQKRLFNLIGSIKSSMNDVQTILGNEFADDIMPNVTDFVQGLMSPIYTKLSEAQAKIDSLGFNDTDDYLRGFMRSPSHTINLGGDYDPANRAGGTYTVPVDGLYKIMFRKLPSGNVNTNIERNGNETLVNMDASGYYDVRTRLRILWLNAGDEIFATGTQPSFIVVLLLRVQSLLPDVL